MSRIAIDARKYYDFGIGTYIRHLVEELPLIQSGHEFLLFVSPEDEEKLSIPDGWTTSVVRYGKYSVSEIFLFGRRAAVNDVSVFHAPHYTLPFGLKERAVVTIHDLIHLRFPELFSSFQRAYSYGMILHAVRDAQYIITDSEFTKHDILRSFRVREEKIVPIHLGVSERFRQKHTSSEAEDFRSRFQLERPYVLFVGNTKPHKGLEVLLDAFKKALRIFPDIDLVIVGGTLNHEGVDWLNTGVSEISGRIKTLGRLADDDVMLAYNAAEMLVLPSLYEGFGLPALEAMACGIPVVISKAASLPEVVGNAAMICESGNVDEFADAIVCLLREPDLRKNMIEKGRERSRLFSWRTTAQKTMEIYEKVMGKNER